MTAKTLTQQDLDKAIAARLAEERKKHKTEVDRLTAELANVNMVNNAARARVAELESFTATLTTERDTARTDLANAEATLHQAAQEAREHRTTLHISHALTSARVLPSAAETALETFRRKAEIHHAEDGSLSVSYAGQTFETPELAAASFLRAHPFLASNGGASGGGMRPPNAGHAPRPSAQLSPSAMIEQGLSTPPKN